MFNYGIYPKPYVESLYDLRHLPKLRTFGSSENTAISTPLAQRIQAELIGSYKGALKGYQELSGAIRPYFGGVGF